MNNRLSLAVASLVMVAGVILLATDVVDEDFEGTGYENTWAETIDSGNTVDEDDASVSPISGGGSQTLNTVGAGTNLNAYTEWDNGAGSDADNYIRFYWNANTVDTGDTDNLTIFSLHDGTVAPLRVVFRYTGASGNHLTFHNYDSGYQQRLQVTSLSLDTWYRIEMRYKSTATTAYEFRIFTGNSTTADDSASGTITTARTGSRYLRVGHHSSDLGAARNDDYNFDGVAWSTVGWIGPYSAGETTCYALLTLGAGSCS